MRKYLLLPALLLCFLGSCNRQQTSVNSRLEQAEALKDTLPDSAATLLGRIERPELLPTDERLHYGWLKAYLHYHWYSSMSEDSLILPAFEVIRAAGDTGRLLTTYFLKAKYLHDTGRNEDALQTLYEGANLALQAGDCKRAGDFHAEQGELYVYVYKDYRQGTEAFRRALALRETADNRFSLGVCLALLRNDSSLRHVDRSVNLAFQQGDTAHAIHYLRNLAQIQTYITRDYRHAIDTNRRLLQLTDDESQLDIACLTLSECYLKLGKLDSAQYYLDKGRLYDRQKEKFATKENMTAFLQSIIDYTRTGTFDMLDVMRYNDSLNNAVYALQNTIRQKDRTRNDFSQANLRLMVDRQRMQLWLLGCLLLLLVLAGVTVFYIYRRRQRLIEAEERIETLNRLLAGASDTALNDAREEDERFFRRVLLQQLGLIRLVAGQPTAQNRELLRRVSVLPHPNEKAEGLLVWEDLYPVIDRVYNGFHARLMQHFGSVLTEKEVQLCCLLRADFSTKEISVITGQSIPTIYQRKTTIRKKLGMDEKEDIAAFIESL